MSGARLRFSANISMLFCERPFMERIGAAAAAGFDAVECHFPYEFDRAEIRARLDDCGLVMNGINTSPGNANGQPATLDAHRLLQEDVFACFERRQGRLGGAGPTSSSR